MNLQPQPRPDHRFRPGRRTAALAGAAVVAVTVLSGVTACSHDRAGGSSSSASGGAASSGKLTPDIGGAGGSAQPGEPLAAAGPKAAAGGAVESASSLLQQRRLILQTSLSLTVRNVAQAADQVRRAATAAGGYVGNEQTGGTGPSARSSLTLQVPSAQLAAVTGQVAALGTVRSRTQSSADVTQQTIDVASRLATEKASVARVRALLSRATRISDIVLIEGELSSRESNLESLEAQLKSLNDQVALATLGVTLTAPGAAAHTAVKADAGFLAGLGHGWHAFVTALVIGLTVVGAVLPFVVLLGLIAVPAALVARRRRGPAPVPEP